MHGQQDGSVGKITCFSEFNLQNPQNRGQELPSESYYLDFTVAWKHSDSNNNDDNNNIDHTTIKVISIVTIWYNNLTSGYLAKSIQIKDINRFLFIQSHSSPHDSSRVEAIQVFIGRWVNKMWCTCTHIHKEKDALLQTYSTNPQRMESDADCQKWGAHQINVHTHS